MDLIGVQAAKVIGGGVNMLDIVEIVFITLLISIIAIFLYIFFTLMLLVIAPFEAASRVLDFIRIATKAEKAEKE